MAFYPAYQVGAIRFAKCVYKYNKCIKINSQKISNATDK